jgi:hypothetical protein
VAARDAFGLGILLVRSSLLNNLTKEIVELNHYMEKRAEILGEPVVTPVRVRELDIDPSLKAFLAMEERLREPHD